MFLKTLIGIAILACSLIGTSQARTPSNEGTSVYFISPANGELVNNPVTVKFGLKGMGIAPAGIKKSNTGHHHLLINVKNKPAFDKPIPADKKHKHFGGGQTQTTLNLPKGKHTLQLLMGDNNHIPHQPPVISEQITINVR